jgi:hypothetical protein
MSNRKVSYGQNETVYIGNKQEDKSSRESGSAGEGIQAEENMRNAEYKFGKTGEISHLKNEGPPESGETIVNTLYNTGKWGGRRKTKRNNKAKKSRKSRRTKRTRRSKKSKKSHKTKK